MQLIRAFAPFCGLTVVLGLSACSSQAPDFMTNMRSLCGQTVTGSVTSDDPRDADWRGQVLTVGPVTCTDSDMRMPLAVGSDQSRVWVLTETESDVVFRHEHTLKDGSPDPVSNYGGPAATMTVNRATFPADDLTRLVFTDNGLIESLPNIWTLEIVPGEALAYELNRPGRRFRAEFPLGE